MKRAQQVAVGILASLSLGLAAISAHAYPSGAEGMGPGMMGSGGHEHQDKAAGREGMAQMHQARMAQMQQGRMGRMHRGATGREQHGTAGSGMAAGDCPMAAQHSAQAEHKH